MRLRVYLLWLIPCLFVVIQFFLQNVANVFAAVWTHDFHLTPVSLAKLSSAYFYTYALMQIPAGLCYDRWSARYLLSLSLAVVGVSCLWLASADGLATAYMARLLIGAACAFSFVGMLKTTAVLFAPRQFALMIGVSEMLTMGLVSIVLSVSAHALSYYGWQSIQTTVAGVAFVLAAVIWLWGKDYDKQRAAASKTPVTWALFAFLKNRNVILGACYCLLAFALVSAFTSLWGVQFLVHTQHVTVAQATQINSVVLVGIGLGSLGWGWLAKQTGVYRGLLLVATASSLVVLTGLLLAPPLPHVLLYFGYLVAGFCCAAYIPCLALIKHSIHPRAQASAMAFANMMIMLGAPLFQITMGYIIANPPWQVVPESTQSYQLAMALLPLSALLAWVLTYYLEGDSVVRHEEVPRPEGVTYQK